MASGEFIGVLNSTRPKYMKGAADLTIRRRLLLAMLRKPLSVSKVMPSKP